MKTSTLAIDRFSRGDEEYRQSPGLLAVGIVFAAIFSGAIFYGLSLAQRTVKVPEPTVLEDLRTVAVTPPPPPPPAAIDSTVAAENAPPSMDLTMGMVEPALPDTVQVATAPVAEIAEPDVKMKFELAPGAFRPKSGLGGTGLEARRVYERAEVDQAVVPLRRVAPKIHPDMMRGKQTRRVLVLFVVGTDGVPRNLHVLESVSPEVDALVVEAVADWTFRPAKKDKQVVQQWVKLPVVVYDGGGNPLRSN